MKLLDLIFAPYCCLCGKKNSLRLCTTCSASLPIITPCCQCCGINLPQDLICGRCLAHPPPYQRIISSFWYKEPLQTLIRDYKFHQKLYLTPILGSLMVNHLSAHLQKNAYPEILIPMPIHPKRLRTRGYHQVHELAKIISKAFAIPINLTTCQRIRHSAPQSEVPFHARKKNVHHVFSAEKIPYQHIAIIEDVVTTGATISALSRALLTKNPSLIIDVWCLARTPALSI